mgnify:CR=1 FL=1
MRSNAVKIVATVAMMAGLAGCGKDPDFWFAGGLEDATRQASERGDPVSVDAAAKAIEQRIQDMHRRIGHGTFPAGIKAALSLLGIGRNVLAAPNVPVTIDLDPGDFAAEVLAVDDHIDETVFHHEFGGLEAFG